MKVLHFSFFHFFVFLLLFSLFCCVFSSSRSSSIVLLRLLLLLLLWHSPPARVYNKEQICQFVFTSYTFLRRTFNSEHIWCLFMLSFKNTPNQNISLHWSDWSSKHTHYHHIKAKQKKNGENHVKRNWMKQKEKQRANKHHKHTGI